VRGADPVGSGKFLPVALNKVDIRAQVNREIQPLRVAEHVHIAKRDVPTGSKTVATRGFLRVRWQLGGGEPGQKQKQNNKRAHETSARRTSNENSMGFQTSTQERLR